MKGDTWMGYSEDYFEETNSTVYSMWMFPIMISYSIGDVYEISFRIFLIEFTISLSDW